MKKEKKKIKKNILKKERENKIQEQKSKVNSLEKIKKISVKKENKNKKSKFEVEKYSKKTKPVKEKIKPEKKLEEKKNQIQEQRAQIQKVVEKAKPPLKNENKREYIWTGIPGFDQLFDQGIPKGSSILIAGGAGSGKTIMSLQILNNACEQGKKCLYMSFEESENRLREHMDDFGWDHETFEKKKLLYIKRFNPFDISRSVDALLEKARGELLIDVKTIILPENFHPDLIVVDSLTAIASAFTGEREASYRIYIEQLFRFLENMGATSFLITETEQIPVKFSTTGVEEFLADGVIVLYTMNVGNIKEKAIEVMKLRGAEHKKKIVSMSIVPGVGIKVFPEQEVFASTNNP